MTWREKLGRVDFPAAGGQKRRMVGATFRDVPFFVEGAERSGGRRTVRHEYPLRDEPFVEDLGRSARDFRVEGYVLGDDYLAKRDALIAALETAGSGELLHPYHGTLRVICDHFTVAESSREGGVARFSISFAQTAAQPPFPSAAPDASARVKASVDVARRAVATDFSRKYSPGALMDSASDTLRSATLRINNVVATISSGAQQRAAMQRRLDNLLASVTTLVGKPAELLAELEELFGSLSGDAPERAYSFDPGQRPPETTPARRQERANFDALRDLIKRLSVLRAAELAPAVPHVSYDEAVAARTSITDKLDEQLETAGDESYPALLQLRADIVKAVPAEGSGLARLLTVTPPTTLPALVLAHQLYGDVTMEGSLVARNQVRHPGFLVGGRELEVLSRG